MDSKSTGAGAIHVVPEVEALERVTEIVEGLTSTPKRFPMKHLYTGAADDDRLFEAIASMPGYHLAEAEHRLLQTYIGPLVQELQLTELLDVGCGSGLRVDLILEAMREAGGLRRYIGLDIAGGELGRWLRTLASAFPDLDARGIVGDFDRPETMLAIPKSQGQRLAVILGQTLGNFSSGARTSMLKKLRACLSPSDTLIAGLDFANDLEAALPGYDDVEGRNAAFSLNALSEINRVLGSTLECADFRFRVEVDHDQRAIVSSLVARRAVEVVSPLIEQPIKFAAGEAMFTEISQRFQTDTLRGELNESGFDLLKVLGDPTSEYGLAVAAPRPVFQNRVYKLLSTVHEDALSGHP